jgi:hypothetical protein
MTRGKLRSMNRRVDSIPVGDPTRPRTAASGYDSRFDTLNNLFDFCPTTVIAATDCSLAGACEGAFSYTAGCGILGDPDISTFFKGKHLLYDTH